MFFAPLPRRFFTLPQRRNMFGLRSAGSLVADQGAVVLRNLLATQPSVPEAVI
jgi:hypothetical protein